MISVLVVDDTILYRKLVSEIIGSIPDVRVVGTASNGKIALSRIALLKPDLVTLDVEMPEMNGIEVLKAARKAGVGSAFLMVSALTKSGAALSLRAIEAGAMDAIAKPDGVVVGRSEFEADLKARIDAFVRKSRIRSILSARGPSAPIADRLAEDRVKRPCEIVAVGVSTGGPAALLKVIPALPADFRVSVLIAQHMPALFTDSLARSLDSRSRLAVKEGQNGEVVLPGVVYIAPGGRHMRVDLGADAVTKILRVTDDPPVNHCRPSVDYLFRSVALHYYGRALGVVMTGMGEDGAAGAREIRRSGGEVIVQDEESSVVWGMPGAVSARGDADAAVRLDDLAAAISVRSR
ncbi:MAG TPA: chemotaxis response regulator protein-glutamate methylesterase [Treponema sp.]|nr:MAG: hypothetical protein A2001_00335 [Treponema sp. GWC1_61_84]HCM26446.1 chemotaxis response regulator protein-glutamate methylesterase [Treponema sp.]